MIDAAVVFLLMTFNRYLPKREHLHDHYHRNLHKKVFYGPSIKYVRKIFRKTNISNPLIHTRTCAYQWVRNVRFSENFAYVLNG